MCFCRSDSVIQEIALGGLEKEDKELNQIDQAVFSKVSITNKESAVKLLHFRVGDLGIEYRVCLQ